MTELSPCPFCSSTNLRYEFAGSQGYIECNECGTEGPCDERAADPYCDVDAAYGAWNRRTDAVWIPGYGSVSLTEAGELLAMMLNGMRIHSPRMNSQHEWRVPGPALGRLVGCSPLAAIRNAVPANRDMIHAAELEGTHD